MRMNFNMRVYVCLCDVAGTIGDVFVCRNPPNSFQLFGRLGTTWSPVW